jgi:Tannase and feruloyl esterase
MLMHMARGSSRKQSTRALATGVGLALMLATPSGQGRGGGPPLPPPVIPKPLVAQGAPARACDSLLSLTLPDTTIDAAVLDPGTDTIPASCRVTATVTHPPAGDKVTIWIGLPTSGWNGRFQGVGGGGFSGGSANAIVQPLRAGYAAGSTDTGHTGGSGSFALDASGRLNWQAIRDNAYLGIHEMTVTGKALTQAFYGTAPQKAYFNGCSTGGRQGLSEAQRYPADYDGILAGAPAINWTKLHPEQMWGQLLMLEAKHFVPACKLVAATAAAVAACDGTDGVKDGVIEDPRACRYDPKALVGTTAGDCGEFTEADASIVRGIWEGPRRRDGSFLWHGLERGGDFAGLSGTRGTPPDGQPNNITLEWFRFFLTQNPAWDWKTLTRASYEQLFDQSVEQFSAVIGTDNPDLSAFRARGGRIVMWHGWSDPLIYPRGSIDYVTRVQQAMGGPEKTAEFLRFFLAPGVGHCGGGTGPAPSGQFEAMVTWVETGKAPDTLQAIRRDQTGAVTRSRILCRYPLVARYKGSGSTDDAASFVCRAGP